LYEYMRHARTHLEILVPTVNLPAPYHHRHARTPTHRRYLETLAAHHRVMKAAMKSKQTVCVLLFLFSPFPLATKAPPAPSLPLQPMQHLKLSNRASDTAQWV
jgi:hypothetical protein